MITRLGLKDFKNFADAELNLGKFTVILGTNASGKSNIRDAFRFLHGVGRGYTLSEIIGGKGEIKGEWSGIRGAMNEIVRLGSSVFSIYIGGTNNESKSNFVYGIVIYYDKLLSKFNLSGDFLFHNNKKIFGAPPNETINKHHFDGTIVYHSNDVNENPIEMEISDKEPGVTSLSESRRVSYDVVLEAKNLLYELRQIRFLDFFAMSARKSSPPGQTTLGDHGENLPTVLQAICDDPARKETLMEWVRALTPMDVTDFRFRSDLNGFVQLYLVESDGTEISAVSASDGTLRFLALLAALLGPNPAKLYFFEEIESGIHPARLHLLIDMLERQTAKSGIQVVTTTHSPELLSLLSDETLKSTSIVYRPPGRSDAIIKPVLDFPNIQELQQQPGLGRLHSTGWFERALAMMEGRQAAE